MLRTLKHVLEARFEVVAMPDNALSLMRALEVHRDVSVVVVGDSPQFGWTDTFPRHLAERRPDLRVVVVTRQT